MAESRRNRKIPYTSCGRQKTKLDHIRMVNGRPKLNAELENNAHGMNKKCAKLLLSY